MIQNHQRSKKRRFEQCSDEAFYKWGYPHSSSILVGFSLINPPFWGTPIYGNPQMVSDRNQQRQQSIILASVSMDQIFSLDLQPWFSQFDALIKSDKWWCSQTTRWKMVISSIQHGAMVAISTVISIDTAHYNGKYWLSMHWFGGGYRWSHFFKGPK